MKNPYRAGVLLSLGLTILIIISGLVAIYTPDFYRQETLIWQLQSKGQDVINLILVIPFLITALFFSYKKSIRFMYVTGSLALYLIYNFTIYCFNIHFNRLFLVYCAALSLSICLFIHSSIFIYKRVGPIAAPAKKVRLSTGIFFICISLMFAAAWLSDIIPAIVEDRTPTLITEAGLVTNPVHVLDLSIFLPGTFITGIFLIIGKRSGILLAPLILGFLCLMSFTIAFLCVVLKINDLSSDMSVFYFGIILTIISSVFLFLLQKNTKYKPDSNL